MKRAVVLAALLCLTCTRAPEQKAPPYRSVIFVGLDGADWQLFDRYMGDGTMPNLSALVRTGERRVLLTQHPPLSPLVWTTMMTGVSPLEHRILDFTRFDPVTHEREPITSDERAVPAIWNMVHSRGKRVVVVGMWATDPPENDAGDITSDRMIRSPAHDVWRRTLAETETTHTRAFEHIAKTAPALGIVYFQGTDIAGHLYAGRDSPIPRDYFRRIDQILGDYRSLATTLDATLVVASDHGFDWFTKRPPETSTATATAAKWHRDEGIFLRWSPHRRVLPTINSGAIRVDQICSLLLKMLEMPTDVREYRRGWRNVERASARPDPEDIAKLTALGYIGASAGSPLSEAPTRTSGSFNNEGVILRERGSNDAAATAFENALRVDAKNASAMWNLSDLLHHLKRDEKRADALLDEAIAIDPHQPRWLLARGRYALERHDCRKALDDFKQATSLAPDDALAFASLGAASACLGDEKGAQDAFRKSLAIDPNQPELRRLFR